ncbi:helix-turn-helix domain-containing protein [Nonomuraea sediminis]|uniref:helix-turn-helix domain-containing protein n=1 Tax=Nonomuraea sediminis TaxID=2835864 RepID=UPI001BDC7D19|nr:helix-turn-helix domain-containing protein [Nonomuraea sediminis]
MRGLLLRLSTLDADAESAVRVIAYFDSLVRDHVTVPSLLMATARLAQCPVGLHDAATGRTYRADLTVETVAAPPEGTRLVWMERDGEPHGLDEIVLERFAVAAEVTLERATAQDPALVELALSADIGEAERTRALRLLGFGPAMPVQALAVSGEVAGIRALGGHVRVARVGAVDAVLTSPAVQALPDGARVGIGPELPGLRVAESWAGARTALRFTGPHDRVVRWSELGALALFADLPPAAIEELPDVRAARRLGEEALTAVRALCVAGSIRAAATTVHLHHSSMAARIARAESVLGFSLADSAGSLRAHLALALVRLSATEPA